jgi:uncharacterized membrane protein YdjX (TVP38/TMEM64 family)
VKPHLRSLFLLVVLLAIPIIPFLFFGSTIESWIEQWRKEPATGPATAGIVVASLATDIFLPVPSSLISTIGGVRLGWFYGTLASWLGMTIGAVLGFAIARKWGRPVALWFSRESDLTRVQSAEDRFGVLLLIMTRGVPVIAEATVLLMGIQQMPWRTFLPPVLFGNLGIAMAYSAFGDIAGRHLWFPALFTIAIALPVLLSAMLTRIFPRKPA